MGHRFVDWFEGFFANLFRSIRRLGAHRGAVPDHIRVRRSGISKLLTTRVMAVFTRLFRGVAITSLHLRNHRTFDFRDRVRARITRSYQSSYILVRFITLFRVFATSRRSTITISGTSVLVCDSATVNITVGYRTSVHFFLGSGFA